MVRKRKRKEEIGVNDVGYDDYGYDYGENGLKYHETVEGAEAIDAIDKTIVNDEVKGEGDKDTPEIPPRPKKRNLHGRYKKKPVPQVVVEKDRCEFIKEDGKICGKGVLENWETKLCRKHAGVKRTRPNNKGTESIDIENSIVSLPPSLAQKREEANIRRLKAMEEKQKIINAAKVTPVIVNNKKIIFNDDDE